MSDKWVSDDFLHDVIKPIAQAINDKATKEEVGKLSKEIADIKGVEPALMDIPKIFYGGTLPQDKTDTIMRFRYVSQGMDIDCYCETKAQGNSSMSYPKKNQTAKLFTDHTCEDKVKVDFKGWGKQNKFCLKANWSDLSHARNIVSARIWADVVRSRDNFAELPELLRTSPNMGAIDGFPVKVYAAGKYQGRYTLNIPKDKWLTNMDDKNPNHCILCGEDYGSGCFRAAAKIDGSDWSDEIHDTVPENIKTRWNEIITFVMNSTNEEFVANLGNYFDVTSLIDYYLFGLVSCHMDGFGKNQLYFTYDGLKWIASVYDMDMSWGLNANSMIFVGADYPRTSYQDFTSSASSGEGNLLYNRLAELFDDAIVARWEVLRNGALSIDNIINHFERFTDIASDALIAEDYAETTADGKFTAIPLKDTNNIQQLRGYALARLEYVNQTILGHDDNNNLWSLSDKTAVLSTWTENKYMPTIEYDKYYYAMARNGISGQFISDKVIYDVEGEDVKLRVAAVGNSGYGFGIAVPIRLVPGESYKISGVVENAGIVSIMYYDENRIYQSHKEFINNETSACNAETPFEAEFIAPDYAYAFAHVGAHLPANDYPGEYSGYKNIVIEKV